MTATGFLTEPVPQEPTLYITFQQLSMIPAGHPVLVEIDAHGTHEPAHDRVAVPLWLHDCVLRVLTNDAEQPRPEVTTTERNRRLDALLMREPAFTNIAEPTPPDPEEIEDDIFDDTEEHEQVHNDFLRVTTRAPTVERPRWLVALTGETGADPCVSLNTELTEPQAIEDIVNQFHDIQNILAEQLDEIMTWARETWRERNAVPEQAEEGPPEGEDTRAENWRGTDDEQWGTELPRYTAPFGVPRN